jgi:hypothetical protein
MADVVGRAVMTTAPVSLLMLIPALIGIGLAALIVLAAR